MRTARLVLAGGLTVATAVAVMGVGTTSAAPRSAAVAGSIQGPDGLPTLSFASSRDLSVTRDPDPGMAVVIGVTPAQRRAGQGHPGPVLAAGIADRPETHPVVAVRPH